MRFKLFFIFIQLNLLLSAQSDLPDLELRKTKFEKVFKYIKINDTVEGASKNHLEEILKNDNKDLLYSNYIKLLLARVYRKENVKLTNEILKQVNTFIKQNKKNTHLQLFYNVTYARVLYEINQNCQGAYNLYVENIPHLNTYSTIDENWNIINETKTGLITSLLCLGKDQQALDSLKKLEKEVNPKQHLKEYIFVISTIGYIHTKFKSYKEGAEYFSKVIEMLENKNDLVNNYIAASNNLAYIYRTTEKIPESIKILEKGLAKALSVNDINNVLLITNNLGFNFLQIKNFEKAIVMGKQALNKSSINEFRIHKANAHRLLGHAYYFNGEYNKSENNIDSAVFYYRTINNVDNLRNSLEVKVKLLLLKKEYEAASKINKDIIALLDSINLSKQYENLQKNLVEYESEKKDNQITILTQKNEINTLKIKQQNISIRFLVGGSALLLLIAVIVFYYQQKISRMKNLSLRSKLARSQFNPHFINNALLGIQVKLMDNNDEGIINYISSIARLSRLILESTFREEWTLAEEIQMVNLYIESHNYRLKNSFKFTCHCELDKLEIQTLLLPSAITQIPLENSIKHGGFETHSGGEIQMLIASKNNQLYISISNNILTTDNKNRDKEDKSAKSRGLNLTQKRVDTHNKIHGAKGSINISIEHKTTIVEFYLPMVYKKQLSID